jgi:LmbE family N-acetylglucosaminyl deacetylase
VLIEAEAIPYGPAQLRGERLLVFAPHPDDEVIACGGLIAQHRRENRVVRVVVVTDGAGAGDAAVREEESRRGLAKIDDSIELEFLRFPDRGLGDDAAPRIREELATFRPDLVLVPSPVEIHPDHFALSRIFIETIQRDETLFADLAVARVAFYEVSQPLRPNAIVDITDVAETKYAAIAEHASQLTDRDYIAYARGLNAYRTMTLPAGCKFAEAYWVIDLPSLRTMPLSELHRHRGAGDRRDARDAADQRRHSHKGSPRVARRSDRFGARRGLSMRARRRERWRHADRSIDCRCRDSTRGIARPLRSRQRRRPRGHEDVHHVSR